MNSQDEGTSIDDFASGDAPSDGAEVDPTPESNANADFGSFDLNAGMDESSEEVDPDFDDPLSVLDEPDPIFRDETILHIDYVPNEDKIVGRRDQIRTLARRLKAAKSGGSGKGTLVFGKSGSGKTLVAEYVSNGVVDRAAADGVRVGYAKVDCAQRRSETQAVIDIARQLNDRSRTDIRIPRKGIATGDYYDRLWGIINELYDSVIIVLDEIDRLTGPDTNDDSDLLMQLSRAGEGQNSKVDAGLNVVGISNDIKYGERLDRRVDSSFNPESVVFPSYDANQLKAILSKRRDAFKPGVLTKDAIPLSSAFAAQEHGDARKAIDILHLAGEIARKFGDERVNEKHVRAANDDADVERIKDLLRGLPTQTKLAIAAVAALDRYTTETEFKSTQVFQVYRAFAQEIGTDVISRKRMTDQIREHDTMNLVNINHSGKGYKQGAALWLTLLDDSEVVLRTIEEDSRLADIEIDRKFAETLTRVVG